MHSDAREFKGGHVRFRCGRNAIRVLINPARHAVLTMPRIGDAGLEDEQVAFGDPLIYPCSRRRVRTKQEASPVCR